MLCQIHTFKNSHKHSTVPQKEKDQVQRRRK